MSRILVSEGETVEPGQILGLSGSTGRSTGPHLHYEVRRNGDPIDPMRFLNAGMKLTPLIN
jgi:murein DD-endopeptidase MepM/ murein hydrolase activator NlpD